MVLPVGLTSEHGPGEVLGADQGVDAAYRMATALIHAVGDVPADTNAAPVRTALREYVWSALVLRDLLLHVSRAPATGAPGQEGIEAKLAEAVEGLFAWMIDQLEWARGVAVAKALWLEQRDDRLACATELARFHDVFERAARANPERSTLFVRMLLAIDDAAYELVVGRDRLVRAVFSEAAPRIGALPLRRTLGRG
jgi:hypothetical protein